jgi:hypothetical protein
MNNWKYKIHKYIKPFSLWKYTLKTANRNIRFISFEIYLYSGFAICIVILNFGIQINFYDSDKVLFKKHGIKTTVTKDKIIYSK